MIHRLLEAWKSWEIGTLTSYEKSNRVILYKLSKYTINKLQIGAKAANNLLVQSGSFVSKLLFAENWKDDSQTARSVKIPGDRNFNFVWEIQPGKPLQTLKVHDVGGHPAWRLPDVSIVFSNKYFVKIPNYRIDQFQIVPFSATNKTVDQTNASIGLYWRNDLLGGSSWTLCWFCNLTSDNSENRRFYENSGSNFLRDGNVWNNCELWSDITSHTRYHRGTF